MTTGRLKETDIAAYFEENLSGTRREEIERILAQDRRLIDDFLSLHYVVQSSSDLETGPAPAELISRAVLLLADNKGLFDIVISLTGDVLRVLRSATGIDLSSPGTSFALRSSESERQNTVIFRKSFDDLHLELEVRRTGVALCTITLAVPAFGDFELETIRAEIQSEGRIFVSERLVRGRGVFEAVAPGKYNVLLRRDRKVLGNITMRITEPQGGGRS